MRDQPLLTNRDKAVFSKGPRTRAAIVDAAAEAFTSGGYEATTLGEIADKLGLSRGSVLFHFESKRSLLMAIVEPLFLDLETLVSAHESLDVPLAPRRRRELLTRYCALLMQHRAATILLVRDLTTIVQMHWPSAGPEISPRFLRLLQGDHPDQLTLLRTASAIGAIIRPVVQPPIDPATFDLGVREIIVDNALAAFRGRG